MPIAHPPAMSTYAPDRGPPEPVPLPDRGILQQVREYAMFLIDRQGRAASWNEGVQHVLGWAEAEWLGQPLSVGFIPEDVGAGVPEHELRQAEATGRADDDRW